MTLKIEDNDDGLPKIHGFENMSEMQTLDFYEKHKDMEERLSKLRDDFFDKNEEFIFIKEHFIDPYKVRQTANLFHQKLVKDDLFEEFSKFRSIDEERAHKWAATTTIINSPIFIPKHMFIVEKDEKFLVPFTFSSYSYLRDFELFFKLIIDPIFAKLSDLTVDETSYISRLQEFAREPEKQYVYNQLVQESLRPFIRSKIAHQQYYVNLNENLIYFFSDIYWKNERTKSIDLQKLLELVVNTNLLLWYSIALIWKLMKTHNLPDWFPENIKITLTDLENNTEHFFPELTLLDSINSHFQSSWEKIIEYLNPHNWIAPDQENMGFQRTPLLDSLKLLKMTLDKEIPDQFSQARMSWFSLYLVGYSLIEERILKPLAQSLDNKINLSKIKDLQLTKIASKYSEEGLQNIVKHYQPKVRNALSHCDYFEVGETLYLKRHVDTDSEQMAIKFLSLILIFDKFETVLDPLRERTLFILALKKIIRILFHNETFDSIDDLKVGADHLRKQGSKLYDILAILCDFLRALYLDDDEKRKNMFQLINDYASNNPSQRDLIWAWFTSHLDSTDHDLVRSIHQRGIEGFTVVPTTKEGISKMWIFKGLHRWYISDNAGALICFTQSKRV